MNYLFLTGAGRSGTTLFEKLLHNHPSICIGSQPFPNLFFRVKEKYHAQKKLKRRYPIGHLLLERDYTLEELTRFLEGCFLSAHDIDILFQDMSEYSGQYMPELIGFRKQIVPGTFYEVYQQLLILIAHYFHQEDPMYIGTKETWLEEFIPFLLLKDVRVLVIIRDPRDIVTSLNFGDGNRFGGDVRPLLYILRHWRKSVSFCLKYETHQHFAWIKYEDMVTDPEQTLEGITKFLNTAPLAQERFREIVDQNNELWQGNSSFERYSSVSSKSMGTFKKHLSPDCIRYIESVCYPELKMLGYQLMYCTLGPDEVIIKEFIEPFHVTHRKFDPGYSFHPPRVQQELRRLSYLNKDLSEKQQREWFIFPEVYRRMKENLREKSGPA